MTTTIATNLNVIAGNAILSHHVDVGGNLTVATTGNLVLLGQVVANSLPVSPTQIG